MVGKKKQHNGDDDVGDVAEAPRRLSVTVQGYAVAAQGIFKEIRYDPSILQAEPRAIDVKRSYDFDRDSKASVVDHAQSFCESLGFVIASSRARTRNVTSVGLRRRDGLSRGIAVNFTRAHIDKALDLLLASELQKVPRP